jgi:hypothetical protein
MSKKEFKDYICRPFCRFFREGQKEEMACRGAQIIELLIENGRLKSKNLPRHGKDPYLWEQHDSDLETNVCQSCPFFAHDCDFHSINQLPCLEPCGGYILLCLLKQNGSITVDDLKETAGE